jgi:hypothetical protein
MRVAWCLTVLMLVSLFARSASANAAANFYRQADSTGALVMEQEGEGLRVQHETLDLHCREDYAHFGACTFTATYELANDTDDAVTARGAFYGVDAGDTAKVALDGGELPEIRDQEARIAIDATYKQNLERALIEEGPRHAEGRKVVTFELTLPARGHGALTFVGTLHAVAKDWETEPYQASGLMTRHIYFVKERGKTTAHYRYLVFPVRAWRGDPEIDVRIHTDSALDFYGPAPASEASSLSPSSRSVPGQKPVAWTTDDAGVHRARFRASEVSILDWTVELPSPRLVPGGPTFGIGGRLDRPELRLRVGVEASIISQSFIEGLHFETDASKQWTVVPSFEAATPDIFILIPSAAVGAGVPIRVESGQPVRVGGRGQITLHFPLIGVVFPIDYYPSTNGWDLSVMGRISL